MQTAETTIPRWEEMHKPRISSRLIELTEHSADLFIRFPKYVYVMAHDLELYTTFVTRAEVVKLRPAQRYSIDISGIIAIHDVSFVCDQATANMLSGIPSVLKVTEHYWLLTEILPAAKEIFVE